MSDETRAAEDAAQAQRDSVIRALQEMQNGIGDSGTEITLNDEADNLPETDQTPATSDEVKAPKVEEPEPDTEEEEEPKEDEEYEDEEPEEETEEPIEGDSPLKSRKLTELQALRQELAEQRNTMNQMLRSGKFVQAPTGTVAGTEKERQELQILPFLNDEEYEAVLSDRDGMNRLLNRVYYTALQHAERMIPAVAQSVMDQTFYLRSVTEDFFKRNPDLLPYRKFVGSVTNEVWAEDPSKDVPDVLNEVAKRARRQLRLKPPDRRVKEDRGKRVAAKASFTPKAGSRPVRKDDKRSDLQRELDEIH